MIVFPKIKCYYDEQTNMCCPLRNAIIHWSVRLAVNKVAFDIGIIVVVLIVSGLVVQYLECLQCILTSDHN